MQSVTTLPTAQESTAAPMRLLTPQQVAAMLGVSRGHLGNLRWEGRGLPYVKVGSAVRYREADVLAYIESSTVQPWAVA